MKYEVYTDGSCLRNPGPGGYAFVIVCQGNEVLRLSGREAMATNNQMELKAITRALKHLLDASDWYQPNDPAFLEKEIVIYSDSAYCVNAISQGWLFSWAANGWRTKEKKPVKNMELWAEMLRYMRMPKVAIRAEKLRGHTGHYYNELVDKAAKAAAKSVEAAQNGYSR